jgi:hypothetical protein
MRLFPVLGTMAALTLLSSAPVAGQEKKDEAKYKFSKGDILKFEVKTRLECTQAGTHPDFLTAGNDKPLLWTVNGQFENAVLAVQADGAADLERRVKQIFSAGHVQMPTMLDNFKLEWEREKSKTTPTVDSLPSFMDKFAASMIHTPEKFRVDGEGKTSPQNLEYRRLVMRRGMMYWPIKSDESTWTTTEEIALPILHDKIKIEFKNTVKQDAVKTGYKARIITAVASLKESHKEGNFHAFDNLVYNVTGKADVEFDMTHGRLAKLELELKITFSGKGQVSGGGEGDVKGVATYTETQVYKD